MSRRSPLGRVRGLGSAKEGVGHWWAQRLTALALVPLALWFVASVAMMTGADHESVRAWAASPVIRRWVSRQDSKYWPPSNWSLSRFRPPM